MDDRYDPIGFWIFILSFLGVSLFFVSVIFFRTEFFVDTQKQSSSATQLVAGEDVFVPANVKSPWKSSDGLARYGQKIYKAQCAMCHGDSGKGDGMASAGLNPPPRNLTQGPWKKGGKPSQLYTTLANGIAGGSMASFAHLPSVDRWALVHYVRSITKDKPAESEAQLEKFYQTKGTQ